MEKYFSIKHVSELTGLSASNIRYYEKEGLIKSIARNGIGVRIFTETEIDWILFLKRLKDMEVPVSKMKKYAYLREQGDSTATERKELLLEHRKIMLSKVDMLINQVELLDNKINYYEKLESKTRIGNKPKY